jgi:hypothetical protein
MPIPIEIRDEYPPDRMQPRCAASAIRTNKKASKSPFSGRLLRGQTYPTSATSLVPPERTVQQ